MRGFLRDNGLSLALILLFLLSIVGEALTGWHSLNQELAEHGGTAIGLSAYLGSAHLRSATFENWESEFLQMAIYVVLTGLLRQRGSPESKSDAEDEQESPITAASPWPARRGGWLLRIYGHSLSLTLAALFLLSFWLHLAGTTQRANEEALRHHQPPHSMVETLVSTEFWFESFQNWQSEFLSVAMLVILGIWLRERGSPESKPVAAAHNHTGR